MKLSRRLTIVIYFVFAQSCDRLTSDFRTDINDLLPPKNSINLSKGLNLEQVTSSSPYAVTAISGFKVRQNVGAFSQKQVAVTPRNFKVFLGISGKVAAEEIQ